MPYIQHNSWKIRSHDPLPIPRQHITDNVRLGLENFIDAGVTAIVDASSSTAFLRPLGIGNETLLGDSDFQSMVEESGKVIKAQIVALLEINYFVIACSWYEMLVISRQDVGRGTTFFVSRLTLTANKHAVTCRFGFDRPACKGKWIVPYSTFPPQLQLRFSNGMAVWNFPRRGKQRQYSNTGRLVKRRSIDQFNWVVSHISP
jgi:hypothetical protein